MIKRQLTRFAKRSSPDQETQHAMRAALQRAGYLPERSFGLRLMSARSFAVLTSVFTMTIAGATGTYAYVSDEVTPNSPLYPVRRTIERAELTLAVSPEAKARVKQRHTERRIHEALVIEKRKKRASDKKSAQILLQAKEMSATSSSREKLLKRDLRQEKARRLQEEEDQKILPGLRVEPLEVPRIVSSTISASSTIQEDEDSERDLTEREEGRGPRRLRSSKALQRFLNIFPK